MERKILVQGHEIGSSNWETSMSTVLKLVPQNIEAFHESSLNLSIAIAIKISSKCSIEISRKVSIVHGTVRGCERILITIIQVRSPFVSYSDLVTFLEGLVVLRYLNTEDLTLSSTVLPT